MIVQLASWGDGFLFALDDKGHIYVTQDEVDFHPSKPIAKVEWTWLNAPNEVEG